jgi:hypothetical protein
MLPLVCHRYLFNLLPVVAQRADIYGDIFRRNPRKFNPFFDLKVRDVGRGRQGQPLVEGGGLSVERT